MTFRTKVTLQDIADKCGIGKSTAAFILNGTADRVRISQALCEKVLKTAAEMGYRHNELASAVRSGKTKVIAYVSGSRLSTTYTMRIIAGINDFLNQNGYTMKMLVHDPEDRPDAVVDKILSNMIAGVILDMNPAPAEKLKRELERHGVKTAFPKFAEFPEPVIQAWSDDASGAAADQFYRLGHRRIGIVCVDNPEIIKLKRDSFLRRLGELGLKNDESVSLSISRTDSWNSGDAEKVASFLRRPDRPTAVFGESDPIALRFLQYACQTGYRVPDDISIIGYADLDYTRFSNPPLSTFHIPFEEIGFKTAELLTGALQGKLSGKESVLLPVTYVERMSTKPFPGPDGTEDRTSHSS